jgi:protein TonB
MKDVQVSEVPAIRWGASAAQQRRALILSVFLTACCFLALPYLEMVAVASGQRVLVTDVGTASLPPPVLMPPAERETRQPEQPAKQVPKPRLARQARPRLAISAGLNLAMVLGDVGGDFDVGFSLAPGQLAAGVETAVFELGDLDRAPRAVVRLRPTYPLQARLRGQEGSVTLSFIVGADGQTRDIRVVASEPENLFVRAAVRAVERWQFKPGRRDGRAVPVRVEQRISFQLEAP